MGLGLALHLLDFFLRETAGVLHGDLVFFAGAAIFRRHVEDAVHVDVERHLDLWRAARGWWNPLQVEAPEQAIVLGELALALQHVDRDRVLIIAGG